MKNCTCEYPRTKADCRVDYCLNCNLPFAPASDCTCASFFTVRGKHKEDCPASQPNGDGWDIDRMLYEILMPAELVPDLEAQITNQIKDILSHQAKEIVKDYEEKLWAACGTNADSDALARILYKASVSPKTV